MNLPIVGAVGVRVPSAGRRCFENTTIVGVMRRSTYAERLFCAQKYVVEYVILWKRAARPWRILCALKAKRRHTNE
jgi:hypothetical protein